MKNFQIDLMNIRCQDENDSAPWDSDEPYVVIATICFKEALQGVTLPPGISLPLVPVVVTRKFGPWSGVDTGETVSISPEENLRGLPQHLLDAARDQDLIRVPIWGINGLPMPIGNPEKLFILVGMMEHDESSPNTVRAAVQAALSGSAAGYANANLSRDDIANKLRDDMVGAIDLGRLDGTPVPNSDDRIDWVKELRVASADLRSVERRGSLSKTLVFRNPTTRYQLKFRLKSS